MYVATQFRLATGSMHRLNDPHQNKTPPVDLPNADGKKLFSFHVLIDNNTRAEDVLVACFDPESVTTGRYYYKKSGGFSFFEKT